MRKFDTDGRRLADYQGTLFERSTELFECSSKIFIRRFRKSEVCKLLDMNNFGLVYMTVNEALGEIEKEFGVSTYGKVKFSSEAMYWMGYMYRYISYTREIQTRLLLKMFPPEQMASVYFVYHTQDPEWCIENLLETNGYTEDYFDRNWRLKEAIRKSGYYANVV